MDAIDRSSSTDIRAEVLLAISINITILLALILASGRPFAYPLDDAYIQMSVARTLHDSGTWGIDRLDPAAASSSPFYVLLLAVAYTLAGKLAAFEWVPLVINALAMVGSLLVWDRILDDAAAMAPAAARPSARLRFALLMAPAVATPLAVMTLIGMEHTLQCLTDVALAYHGGKAVASRRAQSWQDALLLFIAAYLAVGIRYESVLVVGPLAGVALLNRRFTYAAALILGAVLPIASFGLLWLQDGGWLVPNSIVMKLILHDQNGRHVIQNLPGSLTLAGAMAVNAGLAAVRLRRRWRALDAGGTRAGRLRALLAIGQRDWVTVFAATALASAGAQLLAGAAGWLYRYEAAVLSLNLVSALVLLILDHKPRVRALVLAGLGLMLAYRAGDAIYLATAAPADRRWEHVEPAKFVRQFYPDSPIVVNDIGAVAWYSPASRVLDLAGLANNDIARLRLSPAGLDWQAVDAWTRAAGAPLAIIQICWDPIAEVIPDTWRLVALWAGPDNVLFGDKAIGIFATSQDQLAPLKRNLARYPKPPGIRMYYFDDMPEGYQVSFIQQVREHHCQVIPSLANAIQQWRTGPLP
ncbi:hypothetical protein [Azospirillum sp. B4]|uniref:hypothetical protein n=1 Tax=Azospirillum sp. B4 TaxID=95605 RepID=UPI00034A2FED|nr:hypothetical protein [Azospirillum sp. B4]